MIPVKNGVYDVEYNEGDEVYSFRARCLSEQPLENGLYLFDCNGEEVEVSASDLIRERELA